MLRQIGLLPAGCQPWNSNICAASANGKRFAYAATLALYIYELDEKIKHQFYLHSIMSEHKKTITSFAWHPVDLDLIASASADKEMLIWNVEKQTIIVRLTGIKGSPCSIGWCLHEPDGIAFIHGRGPLMIWKYTDTSEASVTCWNPDTRNFIADVTKFRWHPKKSRKVVIGHIDGSISLIAFNKKCHRHVLKPEHLEADDDDPVCGLEWDPLSYDYVLVATTHSAIRLIDTSALVVIMTFKIPSLSCETSCMAWIPSAPGIFVTGDALSGILRFWNVSQPNTLDYTKIKSTGIHSIHIFTTQLDNEIVNKENKPASISGISSGGYNNSNINNSSQIYANGPTALSMKKADRYKIPPAHAVCTFMDGGVGLYNFGLRKWDFLREMGHVETIFDCQFKPDSPNLLGTASFDGTIKIWNIENLDSIECIQASPGNEGIIYSISWAPADINCLAAATAKNGAFIWDLDRGKIIKRFTEHSSGLGVYAVAWNAKDSRRIATVGADNMCYVRLVNGDHVARYKHPMPVYGCDWSPHNKDILATTCEDCTVRVYYIPSQRDHPLKVFKGHTAKVFKVKWSPLKDGLLCTGSDDGTVRIWDYTSSSPCTVILTGHTAPVRGLLWNPEIPFLLMSGSWDFSIRIWDIRGEGSCIEQSRDHGADVYGLSSHPQRPFLIASCSRDSTARLWRISSVVTYCHLNIIAQIPLSEIYGSYEQIMEENSQPLLMGKESKNIRMELDPHHKDILSTSHSSGVLSITSGGQLTCPSNSYLYIKSLEKYGKFFQNPSAANNLFDLINVNARKDDTCLSKDYNHGIMHLTHLSKYLGSKAQELELVKLQKGYCGGIGVTSKESTLREAADLQIRLGNVQKYCELMITVGEWERALSLAPAVSLCYWRKLMMMRTQLLIAEKNSDIIPYCISLNDIDSLIEYYTSIGQLENAILITQAAQEKETISDAIDRNTPTAKMRTTVPQSYPDRMLNGEIFNTPLAEKLNKLIIDLAETYFIQGNPVTAACVQLSNNDITKCMQTLIRGNELEWAVTVAESFDGDKRPQKHLDFVLKMLASRCGKLQLINLGLNLLSKCGIPYETALFCYRHLTDTDEQFPEKNPHNPEYDSNRELLIRIRENFLHNHPRDAITSGLSKIRNSIKCVTESTDWNLNEFFEMIQTISYCPTHIISDPKNVSLKDELMAYSAYSAVFISIRRRYMSIIIPLLKNTKHFLNRRTISVMPLKNEHIELEMKAWSYGTENNLQFDRSTAPDTTTTQQLIKSVVVRPTTPPLDTEQQKQLEELYWKMIEFADKNENDDDYFTKIIGRGSFCVTGSNLPTHSDVRRCYFTNERLKGPVFTLDDDYSVISLNDALAWASVNPFSPLGSGKLIQPF